MKFLFFFTKQNPFWKAASVLRIDLVLANDHSTHAPKAAMVPNGRHIKNVPSDGFISFLVGIKLVNGCQSYNIQPGKAWALCAC